METTTPKQLTEIEFDEHHHMFQSLVDRMPEHRREKVSKMLESLGEFFLAPASSRLDHNSCYPGGLMVHSLNVVSILKKMADALAPGRWPNHVISFVGLFHDLGKAGDGDNSYYLPNPDEWQRTKQGRLFEINPRCMKMPVAERSLYILQKNGIEVSEDEYLAIRLCEGPGVRENDPYRMREPDLALLLSWADRWSVSQEKQ